MNNYDEIGQLYSKHTISGTSLLAFKNLPRLISKYVNGLQTLDHGCGSGRSSKFLLDQGLLVRGVDINSTMIKLARTNLNLEFNVINNGVIPYEENIFDFVFSGLVLFQISSIAKMTEVLSEIKRVLKRNGVFIAVTGSEHYYYNEWHSIKTNFDENVNLKSGDIAKTILGNIQLEIYDYYWTETDYTRVISDAGLKLIHKEYPLGEDGDGINWGLERSISPYLILICKKL